MASTYTTNTGIELIRTGEQSGTWGDTTNLNLQIIDRLTNGVGAITLSGTTHTLATTDGELSDGQYAVLVFGGTPSGTNTVTVSPDDQQKVFIVKNNSGQTVVLTQGSGGDVAILDGDSKIVYCDGAGASAEVVDVTGTFAFGDVNIDGGSIDGVTLGTNAAVTEAQIDNINIDGNAITSTNTDGNIAITPNGTGEVDISKVDIDGGSIDGTVIGGSTPAAGGFTNITVTGTVDGRDIAADGTKLDGIEAGADVTDTTNVTAAGALMDSELTDIAAVKALDQGVATTDSPTFVSATLGDGTASAPSLTSLGDTNTGLYFPAADALGVSTDGVERVRVSQDGRVGINETSPNIDLHVAAKSSSARVQIGPTEVKYTDNFRASLLEYNSIDTTGTTFGISNSNLGTLRFLNTNVAAIGTNGGAPLVFATANTERLRITSDGNVGIGTSTPTSTLDVNGSAIIRGNINTQENVLFNNPSGTVLYSRNGGEHVELRANNLQSTTATFLLLSARGPNDTIQFRTADTERLRITSTGNVGIGTSSPAEKLHVTGGKLRLGSTGTEGGEVEFYNATDTAAVFFIDAQNDKTARIFSLVDNVQFTIGQTNGTGGLLRFVTSGSERLRITPTGNVGIGTTNPFGPLHVNNSTGDVAVFVTSGNSSESRIFLGDQTSSTAGRITYRHANDSMSLFTNNAERLRITPTGNVGIGTSAPAQELHISSSSPFVRVQDNDGADQYIDVGQAGGGSQIKLRNGTSFGVLQVLGFNGTTEQEFMRISETGSLGIGESTPNYKLDVNGTFGFTPGSSVTPVTNGDVVFELTNNTTLTIKAKGSDGVVRSGTVTLA